MCLRSGSRGIRSAAVLLCTVLACGPVPAQESGPAAGGDAGAMILDLVLLRPLGLVATAVGVATFVVSLPFTLLGGNVSQAGKALIEEPTEFTLVRPLGDLSFGERDPP